MTDPYAQFSASKDGQIQHRLVWDALSPHLTTLSPNSKILDAGCGDGWLTAKLSEQFQSVSGNDVSAELIQVAQKNHPELEFSVHDLSNPLPQPQGSLDAAVLNMVFHNIENQTDAAKHLHTTLKVDGKLFVVMPNPYYTFPVARWHRTWMEKLSGSLPSLHLKPYIPFLNKDREFKWTAKAGQEKISGRFSPMPEQINALIKAGFQLETIQEIISTKDGQEFNLDYRASRFPIFLLLVFKNLS